MFGSVNSVERFAHQFILWMLIKYAEVFIKDETIFRKFIEDSNSTLKDKDLLEIILKKDYKLLRHEWNKLFGKKVPMPGRRLRPVTFLLEILEFILNWKNAWTHDTAKMIDFSKKLQGNQTTILHLIAKAGFIWGFEQLVEQLKVDEKLQVSLELQDEQGKPPLHVAVDHQQTEFIQYCLANGLGNEIQNRRGLTPVEVAVKNDSIDTIKAFLRPEESWQHFAKKILPSGKKLLYFAVEQGSLMFMELLITEKINFNSFGANSLLQDAVSSEKLSMVKLILAIFPNLQGKSVIEVALRKISTLIYEDTATTLSRKKLRLEELDEIIRYLLETKKIELNNIEMAQIKTFTEMKVIRSDKNIDKILFYSRAQDVFFITAVSTTFIAIALVVSGVALLLFYPYIESGTIWSATIIMALLAVFSCIAALMPFKKIFNFSEQVKEFIKKINRRLRGRIIYEFSPESEMNADIEHGTSYINNALSTGATKNQADQKIFESNEIFAGGESQQKLLVKHLQDFMQILIKDLEIHKVPFGEINWLMSELNVNNSFQTKHELHELLEEAIGKKDISPAAKNFLEAKIKELNQIGAPLEIISKSEILEDQSSINWLKNKLNTSDLSSAEPVFTNLLNTAQEREKFSPEVRQFIETNLQQQVETFEFNTGKEEESDSESDDETNFTIL